MSHCHRPLIKRPTQFCVCLSVLYVEQYDGSQTASCSMQRRWQTVSARNKVFRYYVNTEMSVARLFTQLATASGIIALSPLPTVHTCVLWTRRSKMQREWEKPLTEGRPPNGSHWLKRPCVSPTGRPPTAPIACIIKNSDVCCVLQHNAYARHFFVKRVKVQISIICVWRSSGRWGKEKNLSHSKPRKSQKKMYTSKCLCIVDWNQWLLYTHTCVWSFSFALLMLFLHSYVFCLYAKYNGKINIFRGVKSNLSSR